MKENAAQILQQIKTVWNHLGLNQRISLVLAAGAVLAGLVALAAWSGRVDYALLYGRLDEAEAARVVAALQEANIPFKIGHGGGAIHVPADKVHLTRMQLAAKGVPRAGDGVGFEIFDKPNFGISDFVQRANFKRAVEGELGRTISQLEMVESARVMIVMPENRLLVDNSRKTTASVFVRLRGGAALPAQSVLAIRSLVANSVEGLVLNNVSVVDHRGNVLTDTTETDSIAGLSSSQLNSRKEIEHYLTKKAQAMLDTVLGPGQAVVGVSAELNTETLSRTDEKFDQENPIMRSATTTDELTKSATATPNGGTPGVKTNSTIETNTAAAPTNTNETTKKSATTQYEVNKSTSTLMQAAGGVRRLSAAVFIAARYEGTGTDRKVVARTPEDMAKLRKIIQTALGIVEGDTTRNDQITLEETAFNEQPALDAAKQFEQVEKRQLWWSLAGNAVYPALALGMLMIFFRAFKKTPADSIPIGIPLGEITQQHTAGAGGFAPGMNGRNGKDHNPEVVTVEVLNALIKQNPDNMAQAIRSWMTSSGNGSN